VKKVPQPWDQWQPAWETTLAACARLGGKALDLKLAGPASEADVKAVEGKLKHRLPDSFRKVVLGFSSKVEVRWFLHKLPPEVEKTRPRHVSSGGLWWDLSRLPEIQKRYVSWVETMADDEEDDGRGAGARWRKRLAFLDVPNGDCLTIDLQDSDGPVIYFDHEMGLRQQRLVLAPNFAEFVKRSTELCCVGPEIWQYRPFLKVRSGLDPNSRSGLAWRKWFVTEL